MEASGLCTPELIKKLRLTTLLDLPQTEALTGLTHTVAYEIPYFDLDGKPTGYARWKLFAKRLSNRLQPETASAAKFLLG